MPTVNWVSEIQIDIGFQQFKICTVEFDFTGMNQGWHGYLLQI